MGVNFKCIISWIKNHTDFYYLNFNTSFNQYEIFKYINSKNLEKCEGDRKNLYNLLQSGSYDDVSNFFNKLTMYESRKAIEGWDENTNNIIWDATTLFFTCLTYFSLENYKYKKEINFVMRHYSNIGLRTGLVYPKGVHDESFADLNITNNLILNELTRRKWILPFALIKTPLYPLLPSIGPIINRYMY